MRFKEFLREQEVHILQLMKAIQFAFKDYDVDAYGIDDYEGHFLTIIALPHEHIEYDVEIQQLKQIFQTRAASWVSDLKIQSGGQWDGYKYVIVFKAPLSDDDWASLEVALKDMIDQ